MYEFLETPTEEYIYDLHQHRHQYRLFINAIVNNTLSEGEWMLFHALVISYIENHPELSHLDYDTSPKQDIFMCILELLDSECDKAINNYRGDLSDLTMGDILHWDEIFYYIGMEQRAKTAINKAFE